MAGFSIQFDSTEVRRALALLKHDLKSEMPKLMEILGTAVLSEAQLAYREKARGGTGTDGIRWAELKRATLEARVRRVGRGRRIVQQRRDLAKQIRETKGPGSSKKIAKLRKRRADLIDRLEGLIDEAVSNHEIGVDTGLQRASAQPGFRGSDGDGGNVFKPEGDNRITVGFGRSYSTKFSEKRPLMPTSLPKPWSDRLDKHVEQWAEGIIRRHFAQ